MNRERKLYIYDFCGTLFDSNTSLDYLSFLHKRATILKKIRFYLIWFVAKVLKDIRLVGGKGYMRIRTSSLKGHSLNDLNLAASKFVSHFLNENRIDDNLSHFLDNLEKNKNVVVLSNTYDFILANFMSGHEFVRVGSVLEFKDTICTGKYAQMINEVGKLNKALELFSLQEIHSSYFITDNAKADSDLLKEVAEPIVYNKYFR